MFGPAEQYLRNLIAARKIDDRLCRIIAFQDPRFNVKISGKVEMLLDRIDTLVRGDGRPGAATRQPQSNQRQGSRPFCGPAE